MGAALALLVALGTPTAAWAQEPPRPGPKGLGLSELLGRPVFPDLPPATPISPRTYGPATETARVISAAEFEAGSSLAPWALFPLLSPHVGLYRVPGAVTTYWGAIHLPAGALITRIELDAVDDSPTGQITVLVFRVNSPGSAAIPLALAGVNTGISATPGSGIFPLNFIGGLTPADLTIDNVNYYYVIELNMDSPNLGFSNVRVYYTLQVSPAPAVATFGDMPTSHPFFRFVEALVASGVTAGCGGGNFCPDTLLTRGEMAAFLSKALGLHFAP
jgi:hypothetical protein